MKIKNNSYLFVQDLNYNPSGQISSYIITIVTAQKECYSNNVLLVQWLLASQNEVY